MVWKGFKFGMLLQIAVGPVCLFIFQTAVATNFFIAEVGVLSVTIIDALYIFAAILGVGTFLNKSLSFKKFLIYFGSFVLLLFGISNLLSLWNITILPTFNFLSEQTSGSIVGKTMILTLSNPLTILFWAGVFSMKIADDNLSKKETYLFGFGTILSTLFFLSGIAGIGTITTSFLSPEMIQWLNAVIGLLLIYFGIKTLLKHHSLKRKNTP